MLRPVFLVCAVLALVVVASATPGISRGLTPLPKDGNPRVASSLRDVLDTYEERGAIEALSIASDRGVRVHQDRRRVMVEAFEGLGVTMLVNETLSIHRNNARICITGIDDVHYFCTDAARAALARAPDAFKIALVHSAEFADVAAASGFNLYLAGHTHGGQVCLPGGRPILTHMTCHRRYASGL